jgi:hypothetical protein
MLHGVKVTFARQTHALSLRCRDLNKDPHLVDCASSQLPVQLELARPQDVLVIGYLVLMESCSQCDFVRTITRLSFPVPPNEPYGSSSGLPIGERPCFWGRGIPYSRVSS